MIWAIQTSTADLVQHTESNRGDFTMELDVYINSATGIVENITTGDVNGTMTLDVNSGPDFFYIHGWLLWSSWGVLGYF